MIKQFKHYVAIFCIALLALTTSCDTEDSKVKGEFSSGVLVVNEGNFGKGNGTVSFYNPTTGEVQQDLFGGKNDGRKFGDVVQSVTVDNDLAYVVVNNSKRVEVVNANTFVAEYTLEDVLLPRYMITYKGKGYLTEWVSFSDPGRVSVVNLTTREIETTITTDYGAENIIENNGKLYVSNNFSTTVSVIDPSKNEVIKTIEVGSGPGAFVIDSDDKVWGICGGGYSLNDGALYRIDTKTNEVDKTIPLGKNVSAKLVINKKRNTLFFLKGKTIYSVATSATVAPSDPIITETEASSFRGLGYDADEDVLYAGDAKGFTSTGVVYRYKADGTKVDNFTSGGIGPNGFVFR